MNIGEAGIELIKSYEQCRLEAYLPTQKDVPTIGWGSTKGVTLGMVWTQEEADAAFLEDLDWVEKCVTSSVTEPLTQTEFDALCSLCFNIGCPNFKGSTLVKMLNDGDFDQAADQ